MYLFRSWFHFICRFHYTYHFRCCYLHYRVHTISAVNYIADSELIPLISFSWYVRITFQMLFPFVPICWNQSSKVCTFLSFLLPFPLLSFSLSHSLSLFSWLWVSLASLQQISSALLQQVALASLSQIYLKIASLCVNEAQVEILILDVQRRCQVGTPQIQMQFPLIVWINFLYHSVSSLIRWF